MILLILVVAFFIIAMLIDSWYEDRDEERNVNGLAKASMKQKKRRKRQWQT